MGFPSTEIIDKTGIWEFVVHGHFIYKIDRKIVCNHSYKKITLNLMSRSEDIVPINEWESLRSDLDEFNWQRLQYKLFGQI